MMNVTRKMVPSHARLSADHAQQLYVALLGALTQGRRYRDPACTAGALADELHSNRRYVSAAVAIMTGDNYNALVNKLRLKDACKMLSLARYASMTVEEIGLLAGFASRQAFYNAFNRHMGCTPLEYRKKESTHASTHKD